MFRQQARRIAFKAKKRARIAAAYAANKTRRTRISCRVIAKANRSRRARLYVPASVFDV